MKSAKLPPGAHSAGVPGTKANAALKGAPVPKPVQIDERFLADSRGGAPLVVGKRGIEVRDNRTKTSR
jgi:hypothetical protein